MNKLIEEIPKNANEVIRVELSEFKGHNLFSFRVYADRKGQEPTPTRKGITCKVDLIPELKAAILKAEQEAIEAGLLQGGTL